MFSLIGGRKTLAGSMIGGIAETQEMLDFCAAHGLGAEIELIRADQINEAYERVLASDMRYRFVIDAAAIRRRRSGDYLRRNRRSWSRPGGSESPASTREQHT